jgi:hypothetical protein
VLCVERVASPPAFELDFLPPTSKVSFSTWPSPKRGLSHPSQLPARSATCRLHSHALQHRHKITRKIGRIRIGRQLSRSFCAFQALAYGALSRIAPED